MVVQILSDLKWEDECKKCHGKGWYIFEGLKRGCNCKNKTT